ncbi:MAG TPA: hypothetical protein VGQ30_13365, partial [Gemmatimonadaceae bacterium]|nr:hypothetical protein [Gemmatimonadaceae bacterium]
AADAGRTLAAISLRFVDPGTPTPYQMRVGQIAFTGEVAFPEPPKNVTVIEMHEIDAHTATVRLTWEASPSAIAYYDVEHYHPDGSLATWLGATPNTAYFVGNLVRDGNEATSQIDVMALGADYMMLSPVASTTISWDHMFADGFDGAP